MFPLNFNEENNQQAECKRREFLEAFVREIIRSRVELKKREIPFDRDKILNKLLNLNNGEEMKSELRREIAGSPVSPPAVPPKKNFPNYRKRISGNLPQRLPSVPFPMRVPKSPGAFRYNSPGLMPGPAVPEQIIISSMTKINTFLSDPAVQVIECPGPDKQILVYKSGVIQNTKIALTNEEINMVMKEISDKTKIPIISGVFKTAIGSMIITAVVSDFIGTRFMIQRKSSLP